MGRKIPEFDLVIIGAGAAGLSAARIAKEEGLSFALLEAKPRIGGRAFTDTARFGFPLDLGAYWMHSCNLNPYVQIADSLGFTYRREASVRQVYMGDRWASESELEERAAFFDRNLGAVAAAGRAGEDVPYSRVIESGGRWRPLLDQWIAAVNGVDPVVPEQPPPHPRRKSPHFQVRPPNHLGQRGALR